MTNWRSSARCWLDNSNKVLIIKIDKKGYVIVNGNKTKEFWDGCIRCEKKPLRLKIRNICGDETIWSTSCD